MTDLIERLRSAPNAYAGYVMYEDGIIPADGRLMHEAADEIERLRKLAMTTYLFEEAPCFLCGYNGPGYYQPEQHPCAALYHEAMEEQR